MEIERSLDRGIVALPATDLAEPILETLKLPEPKISKTPYSDQITGLTDFYHAAKESEMAKKGIKAFTNGKVKDSVLPRHIRDSGSVNDE